MGNTANRVRRSEFSARDKEILKKDMHTYKSIGLGPSNVQTAFSHATPQRTYALLKKEEKKKKKRWVQQ